MKNRRLAILNVSPEYLITLCKSGTRHFQVIQNALPDDATTVIGAVDYDIDRHTVRILVHSDLFEEVPESGRIPELPPPVFETIVG